MADVDLWVNENKIKVIGKHHIFLTDVLLKLIEEVRGEKNQRTRCVVLKKLFKLILRRKNSHLPSKLYFSNKYSVLDNSSAADIIGWLTSPWQGFIYPIFIHLRRCEVISNTFIENEDNTCWKLRQTSWVTGDPRYSLNSENVNCSLATN